MRIYDGTSGVARYQDDVRLTYSMMILALGACDGQPADGRYTGTITAEGCMSGQILSIDVVEGKAAFAAGSICRVNAATSDGFDYDCTIGGGESHYLCVSQGMVHESTDMVHATSDGDSLTGTIKHAATNYSPPDCVITSQCIDTGTFKLALQD